MKVTIQGQAALTDSSTLNCQWQGVIKINNAGQTKVSAN
jgi:hypothetical protein